MRTKRLLRVPGLELSLLGLLASCGGGGSGAAPPGEQPLPIQEPPAPAATYTGSRQSITLTQSNAAELAYRAFSLRSFVQGVEMLWVEAPQAPVDDQQTLIGEFGGEVRLRSEIDSTGRGYVEAAFQDFSDNPGEVIDGRYVQRFRPEAGPSGREFSFAGPGTLEFDRLTISAGQETATFLGVVRISGNDSASFHVDIVVSDTQSGETIYFEDCTLEFSEAAVGNAFSPAVEIAGAVYEQSEGGMQFSSLGPIPDLGYNELAGYLVGGAGGGIELMADGPATHVRPISFAFVSIIMDLNSDGTPEAAKRYSWPELEGETVTASSVMQGPIANAGNRRTPAGGAPVKMHGLFSHDDDGDWLTFEWRLLARPPLSTVSVSDVFSRPFFEFSPDVPGDYVFGLRVSDGASGSDTSVVVSHAPSADPDADDEPVGGLEVGQPVAISAPILIDARSALNWPYDLTLPFWHRSGFGIFSFDETGDAASTWLTVANEGLNEVRASHNSPFSGALNTHASVALAVGPAIFETAIDLAGDANAFDVHKLDFDGDGDADLALRAGQGGAEQILVFSSTPDGLVPGPEVPAGSGELAHGDVNGDGLADFLSAADNGLLLFMQAPDHSLAAPQFIEYPPSGCELNGGAVDIALENADGAGRLDVLAVHPCKDALVTWIQQANGSFGVPSTINFPNHRISGAAFGDLNGDGRTDILTTLDAQSTAFQEGVSILMSQPDGTLAEEYFVERSGIGGMGGTVGDIDNDDRSDAVIVSLDEILLFRQQADGTLVSSIAYSDPEGPGFNTAVSIVDMDDDGHKDLFFCDAGPTKRLLLQQPGGSFSHVLGPRCFDMTLLQPEIAASLDVNNDGSLDLVTVTDEARGAVDERALLKVYLQGVHAYPVATAD